MLSAQLGLQYSKKKKRSTCLKTGKNRAAEKAEELRALAVFPEDHSSVLSVTVRWPPTVHKASSEDQGI